MDKLMDGKIGVVTAGGSGIGRESALLFAREGAKVVVSDISEKSGQETVDIIRDRGGEAAFIPCNVAHEDEVRQLVEKTVEKYGRLDWALNNAGIGAPTKMIAESETEEWNRTINVNLDGMYYCLKYEIQAMQKSGSGAIVNTASTAGLGATPGLSPYVSSKWGVNGLTKTAALEYAKENIRVNSICPGMTKTGAVAQWAEEVPDQARAYEENIPMGRMGTPQEQAKASVMLCSDWSSYITGVNLAVDGGETAE